jgi:hypothetical protein
LLGDRRIVNVNSTATGGGVAEMLVKLGDIHVGEEYATTGRGRRPTTCRVRRR